MRRPINPEELSIYYQSIGQAIYHLQRVEGFLADLYFIKAIAKGPSSVPEVEGQLEYKKLHKKTLGQLIGLIDNKDIVSNDFLQKLKDYNNNRKWIVHNSARESGHELYTDSGRESVFTRILEFTHTTFEIQKFICNEIDEHCLSHDLCLGKIREDGENRIKRLRGE